MTTNPTDLFGIGTTSGPDGTRFNILSEFGMADYLRNERALQNALAPTNRFETKLVELNFHSYLNCAKFAGTLLGLGRNFGTADRRSLGESVMGAIINWLTSFRLHLDYAETQLKRHFGDESEQVKSFEARTHLAFDSDPGYRFIYKFRNYVQHCGPPITALALRRAEKDQSNPFIKQAALFLLDRDALLSDYKDWGLVRPDLLAMDKQFELRPLAETAMAQLREIDLVLLDIAIAEGSRTIHDLREALELIPKDAAGTPSLFRFTESGDGSNNLLNITPQPFAREMVEQYEQVASGQRAPADLHEPSEPPSPPEYDPGTVAARFNRESRAVKAMSLWLTEKGGTPTFQAEVSRMIQEDGGAEVLLTGMFTMTAVLLAMTAAVLGTKPESLLGGLLDIYALQPKAEASSSIADTDGPSA
jgi:hypothetical protein